MVASKGRYGKTGGGEAAAGGSSGGDGDGGGSCNLKQTECCMCGDYGLSEMLFKCKICNFRSQHKYCSNEYPISESYTACNWCLTGNSITAVNDRRDDAVNKRNHDYKISQISLRKGRRPPALKLTKAAPINKVLGLSSPEESPLSTGRKRVAGTAEKKDHVVLRKSKSENYLSNGGGIKTRPIFRNKVRRYKLLEEVSSQ